MRAAIFIASDSEQTSVRVKFAAILTIKLAASELPRTVPLPIRIKSCPVTIQGLSFYIENTFQYFLVRVLVIDFFEFIGVCF